MARTARPWYFTEKKAYAATVKGKRHILLKGEENPANERLAAKKLRQIIAGTKNDIQSKSGLTVAGVIEKYLQLNQDKYSERALEERVRYLQAFAELHGWRKVNDDDCNPLQIEQWLVDHPEWKSDWTKMQIVSIVQRPFNWAVKKRLIGSNPFRGVEVKRGEARRALTDQEFQTLLREASPPSGKANGRYPSGRKVCPSDRKRRRRHSSAARFRQVLIFLRYTGARPGEMSSIRWSDVDLKAKTVILSQHKTSRKTGRPRVIYLHDVVVDLLEVLQKTTESEHVFVNHRGQPWTRNSLSLRIQRARERAGIPNDAKLYGLRHRFGTMAILNGLSTKMTAELMGHTNVRTTEHYLHLAGDPSLGEAMNRANASRRES